jgi:hypothetical protein
MEKRKINKRKTGSPKISKDTVVMKVDPAIIEGNGNGNKQEQEQPNEKEELKRSLSRQSIENAFTQMHSPTALDYLVNPGDDIIGLMMRTSISSKPTEGARKAIAFAHHVAKATEFNDQSAIDEALYTMALMPAVDQERIKLLVKAIIGERENVENSKDFGKWVRDKAFGGPKDKSDGV